MVEIIFPSVISGETAAPPSKSVAQRAILLAALAKGESVLHNIGQSDDVQTVLRLVQQLGADVKDNGTETRITGNLTFNQTSLFCGESGFAARAFACLAALTPKAVEITGTGSLLKRPIGNFEDIFDGTRVRCQTQNGLLPLTIDGSWEGGELRLNGSDTSQILSGLLISTPLAKADTEIYVEKLTSRPYVELSIELLEHFGVKVRHDSFERFYISGNQQYQPAELTVEGDWSGAAFLLVAGALTGAIKVTNLNAFSKQPDKNIVQVLMRSGTLLSVYPDYIEVKKGRLTPFSFDATHCPDLIPPLVALAAHCEGESIIRGARRLVHKESNRAQALAEEFGKMGINIMVEDDVMVVFGGQPQGATCHSHHDHRIAMACAVAGLKAQGKTIIEEAQVVNKSFPGFFSLLKKLAM